MTDYATESKAVSSSTAHFNGSTCCVTGCPLPGTLAAETQGASEWFCRLHFGASYSDYGKITAKAKNREALYKLAIRCSNAGPNLSIPTQLRAALERHGKPEILDSESAVEGRPLTVKTLGRHLLATLDSECLEQQKNVDIPELPKLKAQIETWAKTKDLTAEVVA